MVIDWSKAPEGATRYHPETSKIIEHWLKMVGDEEWIWTSAGKRWMPHIDPVAGGEYYERPAPTWSGEGLPLVGTVCEARVRFGIDDRFVWRKVVVAFDRQNGNDLLVFDKETYRPGWADEFRPIKTPEQIAAEERDKAVHQMGLDAGFHGSVQDFAKRLYALGYRKTEGGAA